MSDQFSVAPFVASSMNVRMRKRKLIQTPDGVFCIRKVEGSDYLAMAAWLPTEVTDLLPKNQEEAQDPQVQKRVRKALEKDATKNPAPYFRTIIERGTISEPVAIVKNEAGNVASITLDLSKSEEHVETAHVKFDGADSSKNEINAGDLNYESTLLVLITAIEKFSNMDATLEGRLDRFREQPTDGTRPAGAEDGDSVLRPSGDADRRPGAEPDDVETG